MRGGDPNLSNMAPASRRKWMVRNLPTENSGWPGRYAYDVDRLTRIFGRSRSTIYSDLDYLMTQGKVDRVRVRGSTLPHCYVVTDGVDR